MHIPKVNKDYVNAIPRTHVTQSIFKLSNTPTYILNNNLDQVLKINITFTTQSNHSLRRPWKRTGYVIDKAQHAHSSKQSQVKFGAGLSKCEWKMLVV